MTSKISTGSNDRSSDTTIAQTGEGLPDDSSAPVDISDAEVQRIGDKLKGGDAHDKLVEEVEQDIELPLKGSA